MIYAPGDTVTISAWTFYAGYTAPNAIALYGQGSSAVTSGAFSIPLAQSGTPAVTGSVTAGTINATDCTVQLTIPALFRGTISRYRSRLLLVRNVSGGVRYAFIDVLNNALHPDYREASSCVLDRNGALWAALGTQGGMEIRRIKATMAEPEVMSTIPFAYEGTLCFDERGLLHFLVQIGGDPTSPATTFERADLHALVSGDNGRTWDETPLPAELGAPPLTALAISTITTDTPTTVFNRGCTMGALNAAPGLLFADRVRGRGVTTPFQSGGMVHRGQGWQGVASADVAPLYDLFRGRKYENGVNYADNDRGARSQDALNTRFCITNTHVLFQNITSRNVFQCLYDYWSNPQGPMETRTSPPDGAAIAGSTYKTSSTHALHNPATNELHLTDGAAYWVSSLDMGRTWINRSA